MVGESSSAPPYNPLVSAKAPVRTESAGDALISAESAGRTAGGCSIGDAVARGFIGTGTGGTAGQPPSPVPRELGAVPTGLGAAVFGVPFELGEEPLLGITLFLPRAKRTGCATMIGAVPMRRKWPVPRIFGRRRPAVAGRVSYA